jgi:hypothetical protein
MAGSYASRSTARVQEPQSAPAAITASRIVVAASGEAVVLIVADDGIAGA